MKIDRVNCRLEEQDHKILISYVGQRVRTYSTLFRVSTTPILSVSPLLLFLVAFLTAPIAPRELRNYRQDGQCLRRRPLSDTESS